MCLSLNLPLGFGIFTFISKTSMCWCVKEDVHNVLLYHNSNLKDIEMYIANKHHKHWQVYYIQCYKQP
jgi:hypothetical protein